MHRSAVRHLKRVDSKLAAVIERVGPCRLETRSEGSHFDHVVRAIIYQQLSGLAARTIHTRFQALYGGRPPTPAELLATPDERLRAVGLSRQKLSYLKDLAARVQSGDVPIEALHELSDEAIIAALTRVKGIGRWTAQMFLMFRLGRPNVLPDIDLGIQKGIRLAYGMRKLPTPKQVLAIGSKWGPYATVACWYLWRSLDRPAGATASAKTRARASTRAAEPGAPRRLR
jgi:DNA-3-methyladenine glycosylase II